MNTIISTRPNRLKVRLQRSGKYRQIDAYHKRHGLNTVCRSAACPNQGECWGKGTATFMILGDICTRGCRFCNIAAGVPGQVAADEPSRVAAAIAELKLDHAVITSVTRDDLPDGGAAQFALLTEEIRRQAPQCRVELLIPDLQGNWSALETILCAKPDILAHNLETVPRLYEQVRPGASYNRSLELFLRACVIDPKITLKSGMMLGMGETMQELAKSMRDLLCVGCQILTLGQYLAPTSAHYPIARYLDSSEFEQLKRRALELGFDHVESGPLVRSSYHADEYGKQSGGSENERGRDDHYQYQAGRPV